MKKHPIYNSDPDLAAEEDAATLNQAELQRRIAAIGKLLIGPGIDAGERMALHKERLAYRKALSGMVAPFPTLASGRA